MIVPYADSARRIRFPWPALLAAGLAGASAYAQDGPAAAPSRSIWTIVVAGIEWPAYFILAGSVATLALIVEHFIMVRTVSIVPPAQVKKAKALIERADFRGCLDSMKRSSTFFARVMSAALNQARHGFDAMHEAALQRGSELSGQMYRKSEYLSILGNLGPLMGLLGTVWGMIIAFSDLSAGGGEASGGAGDLARGISLALVNTMLGLILAVIGLGFFGVCRNRIDALTTRSLVEVLNLLEYFRPAPGATRPAELRPAEVRSAEPRTFEARPGEASRAGVLPSG